MRRLSYVVYLTEEQYGRLRACNAATRVPMSAVVRSGIDQALGALGYPPPETDKAVDQPPLPEEPNELCPNHRSRIEIPATTRVGARYYCAPCALALVAEQSG